ncbi:MAG: hypothetical protein H6508_06210 [Calditrichaeota bacterium]|nr:hypothetical protein [Calditrichota bacterium]MCB9366756.1 hypothetical protein [Calditrichota bacterium]
MNKVFSLMLVLALVALPVLAADEHGHTMAKPEMGEVHLATVHMLNNVTSDHDGHKMAHCACGADFEVTDKSPSVELMGGTYYLCGDACAEHVGAMDAEGKAGAISGLQTAMLSSEHMKSNEMMKDGKKMATCACGQTFEVTKDTPEVVADGMRMDACCAGCAEHVMKAAPGERAAMMKKTMHTEAKH